MLGIGIYVFANSFTIQGSVDYDNNAIYLNWNINDKSQPYTYKIFQKQKGSSEFQSISTADLKEAIRVLNVYPGTRETISYTTWKGKK